MKTNIENFEKLVSPKVSDWNKKAEERIKNEYWQVKAFDIALLIIRHIKANKITQVQLAEKLNVTPQYVNKVLQGKENLTLQTICKIEEVLNIEILNISVSMEYETNKSIPKEVDKNSMISFNGHEFDYYALSKKMNSPKKSTLTQLSA